MPAQLLKWKRWKDCTTCAIRATRSPHANSMLSSKSDAYAMRVLVRSAHCTCRATKVSGTGLQHHRTRTRFQIWVRFSSDSEMAQNRRSRKWNWPGMGSAGFEHRADSNYHAATRPSGQGFSLKYDTLPPPLPSRFSSSKMYLLSENIFRPFNTLSGYLPGTFFSFWQGDGKVPSFSEYSKSLHRSTGLGHVTTFLLLR